MKPKHRIIIAIGAIILVLLLIFWSIVAEAQQVRPVLNGDAVAQPVKTGLEALRLSGFEALRGKRVGLVTNPTGVDARLLSTVDILDSAARTGTFKLAALYGPEHGVRGSAAAGEKVASGNDPRTGVRVFSLYGVTRKPTPQMLEGIDVLVFDIQDIGTRSYTYISTLGRVMEAAAENGVAVVVLDRPNPQGGLRVEGCEKIAPGFASFVSAVGTSVFIMTFTALTGSLSHFAIDGLPDISVLVLCVVFTFVWARIGAKLANKASAKALNRATGVILLVLGVAIMAVNALK